MSSKKGRKRPHDAPEAKGAECPFTITTKLANVDDATKNIIQIKKDPKVPGPQPGRSQTGGLQISPFDVSGKFKTHWTLNLQYSVEPRLQWNHVKAYGSFVLNGQTYYKDDFILVANENTMELQKHGSNAILNPRTTNCWVARIVEIRATDERHVYARVYWMYSPDELPASMIGGKKLAAGRQPYHGVSELIASNHMDIINVVSVATKATVNHMVETDDDTTQEHLYWRQAFDIRTSELSTVQLICKCNTPAHPDKALVACTDTACGTWLHHECLLDDVLTRVFDRLGTDKPHNVEVKKEVEDLPIRVVSVVDKQTSQREPLSPHDVKDEETTANLDVKDGNSDVQGSMPPAANKITPPTETPTPKEPETEVEMSNNIPIETVPRKIAPGKARRGRKPANVKLYEGLFEATLRLTEVPVTWDITDLRTGIDGAKTWAEIAECLVCRTRIV